MRKRNLQSKVEKQTQSSVLGTDDASQTVQFVFSNGSVDRMGDTINPRGWKLDNYLGTRSVLFGHRTDDPNLVVGKTVDLAVINDQLVGTIEFTSKEVNPTGAMIYQLVKNKFLNAVSVGFKPLLYKQSADKNRKGGIDFLEQELLEVSVVPVPALPSALAKAAELGLEVAQMKSMGLLREVPEVQGMFKFKGLYEVSWLAMLMQELGYLQAQAELEAASEGDGSAVPAEFMAALAALGQVLIDMTAEEVAELIAGDDDDESDDSDDLSETPLAIALSFAKLAKKHPLQAAKVSRALAEHDAGKRVVIGVKGQLPLELRAGRMLSSENEAVLRGAHCQVNEACAKIKSVLDKVSADPVEQSSEQPDSQVQPTIACSATEQQDELTARKKAVLERMKQYA